MSNTITINPVTRIEGHAKITIHLDEQKKVRDARFHVVEFRGFEKFCEGRHFMEMPAITARICGICPVSHLLASSKAGDAILGVEIPHTARMLRELMHMGQIVQSHALSFFHLSSPDMLLGWDSDPATRNIMGLIQKDPDTAVKGVKLRKFGQEVIKAVAGKKIHPEFTIAGGVNKPLDPALRDQMLKGIPEALEITQFAIDLLKGYMKDNREMVDTFANFNSNFMGLVTPEGGLEHYDGKLRIVDTAGQVLVDQVDPSKYLDIIAEATEDWSYLKFPFFKEKGYPEGGYRVGPLARLNAVDKIGTPLAQKEWQNWDSMNGGTQHSSFYYHYARLIEALFGLERIQMLLSDDEILGQDIVATGFPKNEEGVGCIEAPRGTLFHHYWVDKAGRIEKVNLIVATGHNNLAMNAAVKAIAEQYVDGENVKEGMLNRVEAAIRCYDPCLSCSTHAIGQMPMEVTLMDSDGGIVKRLNRD
jgi:NAD-reducing hydrogenase large subunit